MKIKLDDVFKPKRKTQEKVLDEIYKRLKNNKSDIVDKIRDALDEMIGMERGETHKSNPSSSSIFPLVKIPPLDSFTHAVRNPKFDNIRLAMKEATLKSVGISVTRRGKRIYFMVYSDSPLMFFYYHKVVSSALRKRIPPRRFLHAAMESIDVDDIKKLFK